MVGWLVRATCQPHAMARARRCQRFCGQRFGSTHSLGIGLILEAFDLANSVAATTSGQDPHYLVSILSREGGRVQCSNFVSMDTSPLDGSSPSVYDALFIAGGKGAPIAAKDSRTVAWLKCVFQTVRVVQAAGSGTLLLKGANLPSARGSIIPLRSVSTQPCASPDYEVGPAKFSLRDERSRWRSLSARGSWPVEGGRDAGVMDVV